jgi:hypothetical protein
VRNNLKSSVATMLGSVMLCAAATNALATNPRSAAPSAFRGPSSPDRRAFASAALLGAAFAAQAQASVFDSTCFGFGCNTYNGVDYGGMAAPTDEESIPFKDFMATLASPELRAKVSKVDIYGAAGDRVYVTTADGKRMRLGDGLPIEDSKGWSSSLWLVRILDNVSVPHTYHWRPSDKP